MLRSNIANGDAQQLWQAYIQLTEAAFRIQKSDLRIRPIWHQKLEQAPEAHFQEMLDFLNWKIDGRADVSRQLELPLGSA